jgi:hypothetical protein
MIPGHCLISFATISTANIETQGRALMNMSKRSMTRWTQDLKSARRTHTHRLHKSFKVIDSYRPVKEAVLDLVWLESQTFCDVLPVVEIYRQPRGGRELARFFA